VFRLRPSSPDDREAILRVLAARESRDLSAESFIRDLLLGQWRIGEFDAATDAVVAVANGSAVGYAALFTPGALAFVDPGHEGQGVGSALLDWVEARARERGSETHRQPVAETNTRAQKLLSDAGYQRAREVVKMARPLDPSQDAPPPPSGVTLHLLDVAADAEAIHAADGAAFADSPDYEPESFSAFYDEHLATPQLDPALSRVARHAGVIAGFTLCQHLPSGIGYIDLLAVEKSQRGRGLGTALLLTAFAAFAQAGLHEARLEVASDNPRAFRIYERAGMAPVARYGVFEKPVVGASTTGCADPVK
jgi:mycothiol synthase